MIIWWRDAAVVQGLNCFHGDEHVIYRHRNFNSLLVDKHMM